MALFFTKSLPDLIRGLRANKRTEEAYVTQSLDECRKEVRSSDMDIKAQAVAKLTYLHMLGYDMSWASFHIVEVMSSAKFAYKRLGYLAASLSFQQDTEVLIMCTNLLKKDLASNNYLEVSLALGCLAQIVTPDLARTLLNDLLNMLNNSRSYIRKRTVLLLYKVFLKYPEALKIAFPRIREKLDDPDQAVVGATVNVICELAFRNPKNYIVLAPQLYGLLTGSSNNWMLIKIVKLFGMLCPIEPRLAKKLIPPLTNLIQSTGAMSLLYECIHTVVVGGLLTAEGIDATSVSALCIGRLKLFLEDTDPNLKYLGLFVLSKLLHTNPRAVLEHKEIVLRCLEDADSSIRLRALEIVTGMVTQKNLKELIKRLIQHLVPSDKAHSSSLDSQYRSEVVNRVLTLCSQNTYELVLDFEWYVDVLVDLAHFAGVNASQALNAQFMDVVIRVVAVREYAVQMASKLLVDQKLLNSFNSPSSNAEVLYAAAWLVGEFRSFLVDPLATLCALLAPAIQRLPPYVQMVCLHAALKVFSALVSPAADSSDSQAGHDAERFSACLKAAKEGTEAFASSVDLEVQQRASEFRELLAAIEAAVPEPFEVPAIATDLASLFSGDLNPVAPKAQKRVPIPDGLDLEEPFFVPPPPSEEPVQRDESPDEELILIKEKRKSSKKTTKHKRRHTRDEEVAPASSESEDAEAVEQRRRAREEKITGDPFYIPAKKPAAKQKTPERKPSLDVDSIPIVKLDIADIGGPLSVKKAGKKSRTASGGTAVPSKVYQVAKNEELPVGAVPIDELADKAAARRRKGLLGADDEAQLADVDLTPDVAEDAVARKEAREAKPPKLKKKSKAAEIEEDSVQGDKTALKASKKKVKKRQIVLDDGTVAESGAADRTAYEEL